MTIGSTASAPPSLEPIIRAAHRLNPCLGIDVDLVAIERATQTSTADEWNAGTLVGVEVKQDGVVSLTPGTPAAIFSQTVASSERNPLAGSGGESQEIAIDLFPDPNILPSPFVLDSIDLTLGRDLNGIAGWEVASHGAYFRITLNAYDDDWRLVPLTTPIDILALDVTLTGSIETIDLSDRRIVFEPGWLYARTGPGRDSSGVKRTANEDANGVSRFLVPRGLSIGVTYFGDNSENRQSAWVGCVPNATAAQFDVNAFWRVATNRHMGPYAPRIGGVSWNDVSGQPDDHCWTGAVPGYGAKAVANGWFGMARRVLTPTHSQAVAGNWGQPYHVLRVATYAATGSVVVTADLGATPLQETEFRADAATPKGTSIAYSLEKSADGAAWSDVGGAPSPTDVTGLFVWHRASDLALADADPVSSFTDLSGNARHLTAAGAQRPIFKAGILNGRAVIRFDGATQWLDYADSTFAGLTAAEVFIVVKVDADPPSVNTKSGLWSLGAATSSTHYPFTDSSVYDEFGSTARKSTGDPALALTGWRVYSVASAAAAWTSRIDGVQHFTTATNTVGFRTTALKVGQSLVAGGNTYYLDGDVADVFIYDHVLSSGDRETVHDYLNARYGFALPGSGGAGGSPISEDGRVLTGTDLARHYRLTATLTPGPAGATKYTTPYLQAWMMTSRQRFSTVRYLTQIESSTTVDPVTGKSEIAELKVPMLRATPQDHRDLATTIATSFPPSRIEAQVYLTNRRSGERWFKESFRLESRNPGLGVEEFTFVTGLDRLKVLIPTKTETFSHADTATGVSNVSLDYTVTVAATSSGPFQPSPGMVGYRVFFTSGLSEKKSYLIDANTATTFTFAIEDASVAPAIGDTFEIHSDAYTRAERAYAGTDFADVYKDVMETLAAVPERYRGALPGTTGRTTSNRLLSDGRVALDVLQEVALHCRGFVTWERGRITFKDFYGPKASVAVWDERHYVSIDTPTGQERRIPSVVIPYGYDFTTKKFTNEATFDDYDALLSLGRANLSDVYKVADELAKWCNEAQAFWLAEKFLNAWSTGVRLWKVKTVLEWPWLRLGDAVSIVGRQYSDRSSAFAADGLTDEGQPIAGRTSALGVIVGANIYGDEFLVAIRGLNAIGQVIEGGTTRPDTGASGGILATPTITAATRDAGDAFKVNFTFTRGGGNPATTTIKILKSIGTGKYAVVATTTSTSASVTTDDQWRETWYAKESLADYTDSALSAGVADDGPIEPV